MLNTSPEGKDDLPWQGMQFRVRYALPLEAHINNLNLQEVYK